MASESFLEIEHKFLVGPDFNQDAFTHALGSLSPVRQAKIKVRDTYFVLADKNRHVFRHRYDNEIQQLTVKSVETDTSVRTEVNIPIDQSKGDQKAAITEFMKILGCRWSGEIAKEIHVAYFEDCEIVFYKASNQTKSLCCVEFEAISAADVNHGIAVLNKYEKALGFNPLEREHRSLFELLLMDAAPSDIKKMFQK